MSHFSTIKSKLLNKNCLVEALKSMGFVPQVHDEPVNLYGYQGDIREQKAHIIVPRQQISQWANDLGFLWNDSEYEIEMLYLSYPETKYNISEPMRSNDGSYTFEITKKVDPYTLQVGTGNIGF